jgi:hypothetical protein
VSPVKYKLGFYITEDGVLLNPFNIEIIVDDNQK